MRIIRLALALQGVAGLVLVAVAAFLLWGPAWALLVAGGLLVVGAIADGFRP